MWRDDVEALKQAALQQDPTLRILTLVVRPEESVCITGKYPGSDLPRIDKRLLSDVEWRQLGDGDLTREEDDEPESLCSWVKINAGRTPYLLRLTYPGAASVFLVYPLPQVGRDETPYEWGSKWLAANKSSVRLRSVGLPKAVIAACNKLSGNAQSWRGHLLVKELSAVHGGDLRRVEVELKRLESSSNTTELRASLANLTSIQGVLPRNLWSVVRAALLILPVRISVRPPQPKVKAGQWQILRPQVGSRVAFAGLWEGCAPTSVMRKKPNDREWRQLEAEVDYVVERDTVHRSYCSFLMMEVTDRCDLFVEYADRRVELLRLFPYQPGELREKDEQIALAMQDRCVAEWRFRSRGLNGVPWEIKECTSHTWPAFRTARNIVDIVSSAELDAVLRELILLAVSRPSDAKALLLLEYVDVEDLQEVPNNALAGILKAASVIAPLLQKRCKDSRAVPPAERKVPAMIVRDTAEEERAPDDAQAPPTDSEYDKLLAEIKRQAAATPAPTQGRRRGARKGAKGWS